MPKTTTPQNAALELEAANQEASQKATAAGERAAAAQAEYAALDAERAEAATAARAVEQQRARAVDRKFVDDHYDRDGQLAVEESEALDALRVAIADSPIGAAAVRLARARWMRHALNAHLEAALDSLGGPHADGIPNVPPAPVDPATVIAD